MNSNKQAILFLENREYDKALKMFQKAVLKSRDVQSLNNLAYYYINEVYEKEKGMKLLEEAIRLQPNSHFPYAFFGQLLVQSQKYKEAIPYLKNALKIKETDAVCYNLAVCYYHVGEKEKAANEFSKIASRSNNANYCYARVLLEIGEKEKAKEIMNHYHVVSEFFSDDLFDELSRADFYLELGSVEDALPLYEKAWGVYEKEPVSVSCYAYCLIQKDQKEIAEEIIQESLREKVKEIMEEENDNEFDEHWTIQKKEKRLKKLYEEKKQYETMMTTILSGVIPKTEFDPACQIECYLFGCTRHGHLEYME